VITPDFLSDRVNRLSRFKYKELTERIINIFYKVYNRRGYGFLEKVYENAMILEFKISKSN